MLKVAGFLEYVSLVWFVWAYLWLLMCSSLGDSFVTPPPLPKGAAVVFVLCWCQLKRNQIHAGRNGETPEKTSMQEQKPDEFKNSSGENMNKKCEKEDDDETACDLAQLYRVKN